MISLVVATGADDNGVAEAREREGLRRLAHGHALVHHLVRQLDLRGGGLLEHEEAAVGGGELRRPAG